MPIEFIIAYGSFGSVLIPLSIAVFSWRALSREMNPIVMILIVSSLADVISIVFAQNRINTHLIGNIYLALQFSLLVIMFGREFQNRKVMVSIFIFFAAFYFVNIIFFQGPWVFNSATNVVASLILILLTIHFFYRLMNELPTMHIQTLPMLWIAFATLVYYSGNFFLFLANNYLTEKAAPSHKLMWILHNLLNITKNLLFAIALWQSYRKMKSSTWSSSAP